MVPRWTEHNPSATSSLSPPPHHRRYGTTSPYSTRSADEADDEHSSSSSRQSTIGFVSMDPVPHSQQPAYPGEDTSPTSRKELLGFYTYSFAAEVFVVCGLGAFIPITLEELARASATAVLANDHTKPCKGTGIATRSSILAARNASDHGGAQCVFAFLGTEMNTASFAMYTFSLSVLLQALVVVTMSGAADHGRYRKILLVTFAVVGSIATMLFLVVTPRVYMLGSLWAIVSNVCVGASFVLLNSFLPLLVRHHTAVNEACDGEAERVPADDVEDETNEGRTSDDLAVTDIIDPATALLPSAEQMTPYPPSVAAPSPGMQLSTKISSYGVGLGYVAAVIVQMLTIIILKTTGGSLISLRLVLFVIGLWWLSFTLPASLWLRSRPGPPLDFGQSDKGRRTWLGYVTYSWANLGKTILRARQLKDVLLFLAAWFMISDAIATVSGTAILFAKTTLGMGTSALALINVVVTVFGITGAFAWSKVSRIMHLKPSYTILACMCLFELIPLYGLLGYIPAIQRYGSFGLQQPWEMYPISAIYGLVLGGLSSYCRSVYGELVPPGSEAAFYALYAITDKGSSVFGPAIVGTIVDMTGEIRPAFWFLAVLISLPIPLLLLVDVDRGKAAGAALARSTIVSTDENAAH